MSALDSDVIKTYVELGLGIGIISHIAYNAERDQNLFEFNTTWIAVRKGRLLREYSYEFIKLCSPDTNLEALKASVL